ncbi:MAG TPA: hypothetical protein VNK70_02925 [Candidatus Paceibacterota bacterium]|nr:hypothetical protein [Candidatus Paceibacterota bacterium]
MIYALILIAAFTGLTWFANRVFPFRICPICAGVSLTWILLSAGVLGGVLPISDYELTIAMLMGGTVVGIAYQGEKVFRWAEESIFRFRVPVIVAGFGLAYAAIRNIGWVGLAAEVIVLAVVLWVYFVAPYLKSGPKADPGEVKKLEEEMKNCC